MPRLADALHRGVAGRDLNGLGLVEQTLGQLTNFVAEGGREKQTLLFLRHHGQHFFNVMDKAHVQHTVGFVQHKHLHGRQIQHALLGQVEQTAWSGHQHVYAALEFVDLRVKAHTAKNNRRANL